MGNYKIGQKVKVFSPKRHKFIGIGILEKLEGISKMPVIKIGKRRIRGYECWWMNKEKADKIEIKQYGKIINN